MKKLTVRMEADLTGVASCEVEVEVSDQASDDGIIEEALRKANAYRLWVHGDRDLPVDPEFIDPETAMMLIV